MLGLIPFQNWHLLWLLIPVAGWVLTRSFARKYHIVTWHNSTLAVSYWEELLFRGVIYGIVTALWRNALAAIIASSMLFGLFHLRNLWWASRRQVFINCLYTGLLFGPFIALARFWTGDIYLGIALHALHNFGFMVFSARKLPTDKMLLLKQSNMNWFERFFSGMWLQK